MNTTEKKQEQNLWKLHSETWKASGLSQKAYCEQERLCFRSFLYQHNRLLSKSKKKASLSFVEAKPEPILKNVHTAGLQLILPNGIRIGIGTEINPQILQTVLSIAGGIKC